MRKITFLTCFVLLFLSHVLQAWGQESNQPFSDVDQFNKYYRAITYLKNKGVIQGYEDGTFKPFQMVNRAEALKIILLGSQKQIQDIQNTTFPDTGTGAWYNPYVGTGLSLGIVQGYPDGTFKPEQTVNKVESLKMLLKTNNITPPSVSLSDTALYEDTTIDEKTLWYQPYVFYAHQTNIVEPDTIVSFAPDYPMSRGRIVEMMYRLSYIQENHIERYDTSQIGVASYYGNSFEGRGTSSGDSFSNNDFSAAHTSLPFNTFVEVIDTTTGINTIVRINDRGPYVENRIIDLSQSAFSALEKLSQGLANVKIIPLGVIPGIRKGFIATDTFFDTATNTGITLDSAIPNLFVKNEIFTVNGTVSPNATTVTAVLTNTSTQKKIVMQTEVIDYHFSLPLLFTEEGHYTLNVIPGTAGIGYADIYVTKEDYFPHSALLPNVSSPQNVRVLFNNGTTSILWDNNGNNQFKVHFEQGDKEKIFHVNSSSTFNIPYDLFSDFTETDTIVFIEGARSSTSFSIDRFTTWNPSEQKKFKAVTHEYEVYKKDNLVLLAYDQFLTGSTLHLQGTANIPLEKDIWYMKPSGWTEKISLSNTDNIAKNEVFSFDIPVMEKGTYIVEINDTNGEAVFNMPFYQQGDIPLLPNPRDNTDKLVLLSSLNIYSERTKMLTSINTERAILSLSPLTLETSANNLAQARSDDMALRNYFSHITPEGHTVHDIKTEYNITVPLGENLAKDNNPVIALYGLMRSPAHRNLLLSSFTSIGIGLSKASDGQIIVCLILF